MVRRMVIIALIALVQVALLLSSMSGAQAARSHGLATDFYPSGSHVIYFPAVSNAGMDCRWGFFCEGGVPVFHLCPQDQLHCLGGWAQYAGYHRNHLRLQFVLYASSYESGADSAGKPWSRVAYEDFLLANRINGYHPLQRRKPALSGAGVRGSMAAFQPNGSIDLVVMAAWTGTLEVEGLTVFTHRSSAMRRAALRDLRRQVGMTVRQAIDR